MPGQGLGDRIGAALALLGVEEERIQRWVGKRCRCKERRERLNQLGAWAKRVIGGKIDKARNYLEEILNSP